MIERIRKLMLGLGGDGEAAPDAAEDDPQE